MSNSSPSAPPPTGATPFEWLAGGLFPFGRGGRDSADIDSCSDVTSLLHEMDVHLSLIISRKMSGEADTIDECNNNDYFCPDTDGAIAEAASLVAARLSRIRLLLYEERRSSFRQESFRRGTPPIAETTVHALTHAEPLASLLPRLLSHMCQLPFESRKDVSSVFNYLLVCGLDGADAPLYQPIMNHFCQYVEDQYDNIMTPIIRGHNCGTNPDVALHCGSMLRSTLRHVNLYRELVSTTDRVQRYVFPFLDAFVHSPNFDVASDATESLRLILTGGDGPLDEQSQETMAGLAAEFLARDYDALLDERFNCKLLSSEKSNYMTRRLALQILSSVLLTRSNYNVMIRYIASKSNLILVMNLLRNTSPHITLDAFHVFKIFVANPNKPPEIIKILVDNKLKLCRYLETLHKERALTDIQFRDEKSLVIATLEGLRLD